MKVLQGTLNAHIRREFQMQIQVTHNHSHHDPSVWLTYRDIMVKEPLSRLCYRLQ